MGGNETMWVAYYKLHGETWTKSHEDRDMAITLARAGCPSPYWDSIYVYWSEPMSWREYDDDDM